MNLYRGFKALLALVAAAALFGAMATGVAAQQTATIEGTVTDARTGEPISGVQVHVPGTPRGTLTGGDGTYRITGVPAGEREVRAQRLGFTTGRESVTLAAGATVTLDFALRTGVVDMEEIIVTGVAGETPRAKLPISVDRISAEQMPVPAVSAAGAIQGKVAGAQVVQGTGRPGAPPTILLRAPTSINSSGRDQEPLYIVDGVILGASMVDIDALDIESIEVVKGAAAASLYGSRAASGVVQITTRRGTNVQDDRVRYTARTEFGRSELPGAFNLTQRHQFRTTTVDGQRMFVDESGNPCPWLECASNMLAGQRALAGQSAGVWNTLQVEAWPGPTHDHVAEFFRGGDFQQHYLAAEGRSGATNYHVSYSNLNEAGVMPGQEGFNRHNFRLNLDQAVRENVQLSGSAFYSRSHQNLFPESQGNPMFLLTRQPAGVSLRACEPGTVDAEGNPVTDCTGPEHRLENLILQPDRFNENQNPLYEMLNRNWDVDRGRFLGSANLRFSPVDWFFVDGNVSYDRLDYHREDFVPKGFRNLRELPSLNEGNLFRRNDITEALNASVTGTFLYNLGDLVNTRTQLRYLWEQQDFQRTDVSGFEFQVAGVPHFGNLNPDHISAGSLFRPVRSDGFFAITEFDVMDRYIINALVRNDGSSLFGPDERRHWYYRLAGAWRLSEEPFFQTPWMNELKLRYAVGTAGGRPAWAAQYETYNVTASGITPVTLGNTELRPEHSTEHEFGLEAAFLDRFAFVLNYATTVTDDQILLIPQPGFTGFSQRWANAGTLESNTWEATLDATLFQTRNVNWSARLLWDRTEQTITALNVPAYTYGVTGQNMGDVFYAREGEALGTFYGGQFATSCDHLPDGMSCEGFAVNSDGFLVWQGDAPSPDHGWGDEDAGHFWGTSGPEVAGVAVRWGTPFLGRCEDRVTGQDTTFCPLGNTMPDYKLGFSSNFNWRGLTLYGLLESVQGISVYNQPLQWATFQWYSGIMDQTDVSAEEQKPLGYYDAIYGVTGLQPSSVFVEDASFVKLRELSARYRFGSDMLGAIPGIRAFDGVTLSLTGRNLLTWTDYDGYDPEVGRGGGQTGSAALARVDGFNYPNFRTWTLGLELNF